MSPEQVRHEELDTRSDLFSFGLVVYEMACGQRAFTGQTLVDVHQAILHQTLRSGQSPQSGACHAASISCWQRPSRKTAIDVTNQRPR